MPLIRCEHVQAIRVWSKSADPDCRTGQRGIEHLEGLVTGPRDDIPSELLDVGITFHASP